MSTLKAVQFKDDSEPLISKALLRQLLIKGRQYGLNDITPMSIDKIALAQWVGLKCRYGCNKYNTNWTCPPATPGPEEIRGTLGEYTVALFLEGTKHCPDFYRNNHRKRAAQVRCWKGTVILERMLFLQGYYKAFSLVGECCALCKECAFPENCRFPQEKRPSVESCSIDVIGTLHNLKRSSRVATETNDSFNYYAIILLA